MIAEADKAAESTEDYVSDPGKTKEIATELLRLSDLHGPTDEVTMDADGEALRYCKAGCHVPDGRKGFERAAYPCPTRAMIDSCALFVTANCLHFTKWSCTITDKEPRTKKRANTPRC